MRNVRRDSSNVGTKTARFDLSVMVSGYVHLISLGMCQQTLFFSHIVLFLCFVYYSAIHPNSGNCLVTLLLEKIKYSCS